MYYPDYVAWLNAERAKFTFDPGVVEVGPLHNPTRFPASPPWNMDWLIRFSDGMQAYLYERWFPMRGSLQMGQRAAFSFHYGTVTPLTRGNGFPARDKGNHPAHIRIDLDVYGPHLHFHAELPHIGQEKVTGMVIERVNPFEFVRAVLEHRATKADFDSIMKFTVIP